MMLCIDFVKEVLHKESLPVTKLNGYTQLMDECDEIEIEPTRAHVKRKLLDVQVKEHNTEEDKTETVVSDEKETCQPLIKIKPVTLAEQLHNNDEGSEVKRYIIRRTRMFDAIETELKAGCKKWGVGYIDHTSKDELPNKTKSKN